MAGDRAILFPLRVTGTEEAARAFKSVGEAAKQAIGGVASAAAAQANYEAAAVRAHTSAATLGAAQAKANQELLAAKAALAAGTISAEAYATAQLSVKNALVLVKAENAAATADLRNSSTALVAARTSAQGLNPALLNVGRSAGQTRAGFQQLGFQINDVTTQLSMGTPAMQVFSQQSGQVLQSVSMLTGGAGKFATFMMGPWGLALTAGVSLVALLGSNLLDTGDAVEKETEKLQKNARETESARLAKALFGKTEEGVTQAIYDQKDALDKHIDAMKTDAERSLQAAKNNLAEEITIRDKTKALLEQAIAYEANYTSGLRNQLGGEGAAGFDIAAGESAGRRSDLEAKLAKEDAAIGTAQSNLTNWQSLASVEAGGRSAADKVKREYEGPNGLIELARQRAIAEGKVGVELERQVKILKDQQAAKLKALSESGRGDSRAADSVAFGLPVRRSQVTGNFGENRGDHTHAGVDMAVPVGTPVHATQSGQVKYAGSAGAYGNLVKIDHGAGTETRYGHLSRFAVDDDAAVAKGDLIGYSGGAKGAEGSGDSTGPHLHYEVRRNGKAVNPLGKKFPVDPSTVAESEQKSGEAAERKAEQLRQQAIRRAQQFGDAVAGADRSLLDAKRNNVHDAATLAALDRQDIAAVKAKTLLDIAAKEQLGDYTKVQADQLREKAEQTAAERLITIDTREAQRQADEKLQLSESDLATARDQLEAAMALAKTSNERRVIQLALLEIDKRSEKARLEALAADETAAAAARADARKRLANLDSIYSDRRQATLQQTAGPGEAYLRDLSRTPDQMNEALQQVKVDGLQELNDGLVDAIVNFRSLGDVAQNVLHTVLQGLVRLSVEKYVTTPLANKLFPEQAATVANDNAAKLTVAGVEMIAAGASLTSSAALWALTATQIQLAAAALAASGGGGGGGGGGSGGALGALFDAVLGGGSGGGGLAADVNATIAANPGVFASGTDMVPVGKPFFVGENGREMMRNRGGGRLEVINGPRTHRAVNEGGGGMTLVQHINVPERVDPRRTADGIARSTQGALARAHRKGLAMTRGRD